MILESLTVGRLETNCYITGDEKTNEVMVIDPGDEDEKIYKTLVERKYEVIYIVLTHGHADHISAVKSLKEKTGAQVAIHQADSAALLDGRINLSIYMGSESVQVPADIELKDNSELKLGSYLFQIMHTPGHTPGGICIWTGNTLFSGDTLFWESIGRTDLPGGDYEQLLNSIREKLMRLEDSTVVYPGHGNKTTIGHERKYNLYIR